MDRVPGSSVSRGFFFKAFGSSDLLTREPA